MTVTAYLNARIYTVNRALAWTEAVVVRDGKIEALGTESDLQGKVSSADQVVDLEERMVMPGIHDAYANLVSGLEYYDATFPQEADEQPIIELGR